MQGPVQKLAVLAVCCCLASIVGCAQTAETVGGWVSKPWRKKTPAELMNVKTPDDRAKEFRELRDTAKKKSPEEQQRTSEELAKEIQREKDPVMRRHILRTLAAYPTPAATAVLVAALSDSDSETRRLACDRLASRHGKEAVPELTRVLTSDTNPDVRLAAVRALGLTRDAAAVPPLVEALADADPAMQTRAVDSLTSISGHYYGNNLDAWRQYAQTGKSDEPEISLVERFRRSFY